MQLIEITSKVAIPPAFKEGVEVTLSGVSNYSVSIIFRGTKEEKVLKVLGTELSFIPGPAHNILCIEGFIEGKPGEFGKFRAVVQL